MSRLLTRVLGEVSNLDRELRARVSAHRERMPDLQFGPQEHEPTIWFLAPDYERASGGIRTLYRQAQWLDQAGVNASVLHRREGFRCPDTSPRVPVANIASTRIGPRDLVVVPEVWGPGMVDLPVGVRHVAFNQSGHLTWAREGDRVSRHLQESGDLAAVVTVSEHSRDLLSYAYPELRIERLHLGIDAEAFPRGSRERHRQLAYMPRRGQSDAVQVLALLDARGLLDGWSIVLIDGASEAEVAATMRESKLFLSFAYQEGFGLPAVEAMASGCVVIGFDGFGGREFLRPEWSIPVPTGDVLAFAQAVEGVLERDVADRTYCPKLGQAAAEFVGKTYSMEREAAESVALFSELLQG